MTPELLVQVEILVALAIIAINVHLIKNYINKQAYNSEIAKQGAAKTKSGVSTAKNDINTVKESEETNNSSSGNTMINKA